MSGRTASRCRLPLVAVTAAVALVASVAPLDPAGAAPAPPVNRAGSHQQFRHQFAGRNSAGHGLPRVLEQGSAALPAGVPSHGRYAFLLRLGTRSTLSAYRRNAPQGKSTASAAAKSQFARIKARQAGVIAALPSRASVLYKTHSVLAGVAVVTDVHNYGALQAISGVQAVYPIAPKTVSNSYAMPLQHAPQAWQAHGDLGANSTIAIIDTGIDYTHANFGGPGTTGAYDTALANDTSDPTYPDPAKIVGGHDFAGDAYNPDDPAHATPVEDNNPLDCTDHGSHVAGIAAGYGENPDGSTFPHDPSNYTSLGSLNTSDYQDQFRIGPGMAPLAHLLAYKVFGCAGSTDVVGAAIDAAADPNGDGDPSDHADVINMSLGADYASPQDGDSVESNLASQLGITVAVASGNGGDFYDVGGSPGDAVRTIAVANSEDAYNQIDTLHATVDSSPGLYGAQRSAAYLNWGTVDLSGTVVKLSSANADGCDPLDTTDAAAVDGKIAFLEWTDNDATRRCGSAVRSQNVFDAGATGAILGEDEDTFAAGILGVEDIPVVQVVKSAADSIRAALAAAQPVSVSGTTAGDFSQLVPTDDDKVNTSSSRGIRGAGNVKPDVSAVGTSVFSTAMGTGNEGVSFTGTSMATPMVAGLAALVKSMRHDWTPEEIKADIMNTAGQDLFVGNNHTGRTFAPNRVGAGRIEADTALDNLVSRTSQDDPGAVSVSFGPVAITAKTTLTKTIKVVNKSLNPATFTVGYHAITSVPGVGYHVSPSSITLGAAATKTVTVQLLVTDPTALTKTRDGTVARQIDLGFKDSNGDEVFVPREFLADASGRVELTPSGAYTGPALRVPVYSAPRPASTMTQPSTATLSGSGAQIGGLKLSGHALSQGSGAAKIRSYVGGFELQATSGRAPTCAAPSSDGCVHFGDERSADLKYVGTTSDYPLLRALGDPTSFAHSQAYFAIATQRPWRTVVGLQEFDVLIDTNADNVPDAIVYNTRLGSDDIFLSELLDITDPNPANWFVRDDELINDRLGDTDTALFDSDTMVLPVWPAALGRLTAAVNGVDAPALPGFSRSHSRIHYGVETFGATGFVDSVGVTSAGHLTLSTDVLHTGVEVVSPRMLNVPSVGLLLNPDQPSNILTVRRDVAAYNADHGKGALLIHFHNKVGAKAQVLELKSKPKVAVALSASKISLHHSISAKVTVANTAGRTPTGKVVLHNARGRALESGRLSHGKIRFTWTPRSRGTFRVFATYVGDANYSRGTSAKARYKVT